MSIQSEITLLQNTKDGLRTAIMEKGVTVYDSDLFSTYPTRISQISMTPGDKDALFRSILERNVTELEIPDGVKYIAPYRFYGITTLTSLTIPATVETIGDYAFNGCSSLESITINAVNPPYLNSFTDGQTTYLPFDDTNNCPIYVPKNSVDAYKAASNEGWTRYASRIQAVKSGRFQMIDSHSELGGELEGRYIIGSFGTDYGIALNAPLIASTTTASDGINDFTTGNLVQSADLAAVYDESITGYSFQYYIPVNATSMYYSVYFDGTYLYWMDAGGTKYYLGPNAAGSSSSSPYVYTDVTTASRTLTLNSGLQFKAIGMNGKYLLFDSNQTSIYWFRSTSGHGNPLLYKYIEE